MQDMNKKTYENPNEAYFVDNIHDCWIEREVEKSEKNELVLGETRH
jgi:hypothetical protein